ncbi:hypothetical protein [Paroceanicella profunda]|uniref:hypothetical protein n=1 Tax=Paroceanicella profunda TaxID=2579971 RepID=UPI001EF0107C|nr:hypothetical protein [Paroceanicella profunda]
METTFTVLPVISSHFFTPSLQSVSSIPSAPQEIEISSALAVTAKELAAILAAPTNNPSFMAKFLSHGKMPSGHDFACPEW